VRDGTLRAADLAPGVVTSGPRGPRGAQGPSGPQGAAGPTGADVAESKNPAIFRAHSVTPQTNSTQVSFEQVLMGGEDFDPHDVYDPGASVFKAPIDGYYEFYATVLLTPSTNNRIMVALITDATGQEIRGTDLVTSGDQQSHVSGVIKLKAGQRVWPAVYRTQIATVPGGSDGRLSSFGGYLVSAS